MFALFGLFLGICAVGMIIAAIAGLVYGIFSTAKIMLKP